MFFVKKIYFHVCKFTVSDPKQFYQKSHAVAGKNQFDFKIKSLKNHKKDQYLKITQT